ncbi:MAG: bifunctional diguanylate cyclase/phosphodiesterase, partial [Alphaproteobacteria bacterium]
DLDRFKAVNDTFGHAAGDAVLCRVSGLLLMNVGDVDLVARVGGDEFLIIQRGGTEAGARLLATRLLSAFSDEANVAPGGLAVGVSIGIALFPRDGTTLQDVRHHADVALYQAKQSGRGAACFFDRELDREVRERRQIERDLERAIGDDELHLVYQPIVATASRRVTGYEALLRWQHPLHGLVSPHKFIPIAEETSSIIRIGEWALRTACSEASAWPDDLRIAVNVSAIQIESQDFAEAVEGILSATRLTPSRLELEVTESVMLRNSTSARATLQRLKARGIRIVMDDFGTGYSSLSNLQAFPFDKIKIDRGFIGAMEHDEAALSIVRAVVGLGTSLRLPIVAEGVETEAQYEFIMREGCAEAQGYLFGMPSPAVQDHPRLCLIGA